MKLFKFFSRLLLTLLILFASFFYLAQKTNVSTITKEYYEEVFPCTLHQEFSVDRVDSKFGVSREEFIELTKEAGNFWNNLLDREVFRYNSEAQFKVNLIFDERQRQTLETQRLDQELKALEISRGKLLDEYNFLGDEYKKSLISYNEMLSDYKNRIAEYEKEIERINSNGGASEEEYKKINKENKKIKDYFDDLEKQRRVVNELAGKTNNLAVKENQIVNNYNGELNTYKSQFGDSREFEKGEFSGQDINIYQFQKIADLKLTLIHEVGHYLGLEHVGNSKSIMYYLIGDQSLEKPELTLEDKIELKRACKTD